MILPKYEFSILKMRFLKVLVILLISNFSYSNQTTDLQLWSKFKVQKKFGKKESINIFYGNRVRENISITSKDLIDISYQKSIKDINLRFGYRNTLNYSKKNQKINSIRYYVDSYFKYRIGRILINNRLRYQTQHQLGEVENTFRLKTNFSYSKHKKIKPEISLEFFKDLILNEDKLRVTSSIIFDLKKRFEYEIYFRAQSLANQFHYSPVYIIGSSLSYRLK